MITAKIPYRPLENYDRLDDLISEIGDAKVVLLGEASHGTSEYYTLRARISRRLIEEKGFQFIAVEGDWPDCYEINGFVRGWGARPKTGHEALMTFDRWPTWMWANWEVAVLIEWMRLHNSVLSEDRKVGFYGLDVYSLWESLDEVVKHFAQAHSDVLPWAEATAQCFSPFHGEGQEYAYHTLAGLGDCEDEVLRMLRSLKSAPVEYPDDVEAHFNAEQNARVTLGAERYYRTMVRGTNESWNIRDIHMADTLDSLLQKHGPQAKAIVWEHNTHIGDARATDMARVGMVNVGQLARERWAGDVYAVGFGSYEGSVIAGRQWGAPMEKMSVPPAKDGSWEQVLHHMEPGNKILFSRDLEGLGWLGHRAIGVVYRPEFERTVNYVPSLIADRYDAFVFMDRSTALHPLKMTPASSDEPPETYPWGF